MVGLECLSNLSQRHIQHRILRSVAAKIAEGLRDTDSVARISEECFGVMVVDAPREDASSIVERWETELQGQLIDDGAGGMIELRTESSFHQCDLSTLEDNDASQIAHSLISTVEQSLVRDPSYASEKVWRAIAVIFYSPFCVLARLHCVLQFQGTKHEHPDRY